MLLMMSLGRVHAEVDQVTMDSPLDLVGCGHASETQKKQEGNRQADSLPFLFGKPEYPADNKTL
jgi:hypothetical protein